MIFEIVEQRKMRDAEIERRYLSGETIPSIAASIGSTRGCVHAVLVKRGVPRRKRGGYLKRDRQCPKAGGLDSKSGRRGSIPWVVANPGRSSDGRAAVLHAAGRRFDSIPPGPNAGVAQMAAAAGR